jgi:hypothetical protein
MVVGDLLLLEDGTHEGSIRAHACIAQA